MRPARLHLYVALVALAAAGAVAAVVAAAGEGTHVERPLLVAAVAALVAAEHLFGTRIRRGRGHGETTTHEEAYIVFLALLEPPLSVVVAIAAGFVIGSVLVRRPLLKALYNVAATTAAVAVGMLAAEALGGSGGGDAGAIGAALAAVMAFSLANRLFLSGVLAVAGASPFRTTVVDDIRSRALFLATNAALGVLAGLAARETLVALPVALAALAVLHFTLQGHGRARAEREKLQDIIDSSTNGILVVGERGTVTTWSAACAAITGYGADEICGRSLRDVRAVLEAEPYEDEHATPPSRYATRIRRKDGDLRWLLITRATLPEGGDLLVVHDDTARRAVEELRVARRHEQARADLLAAVSHELRTPLTSIIGFAETLLARELPPEEQRRYLGIIRTQTHRLERLVDELLELRSLGEGDVLRKEPLDLHDVLRRELAAFAPQLGSRTTELDVAAGDATVHADRGRIEQVVANFLSNAIKYSGADAPIRIRTRTTPAEVRVEIEDEGVGIAPDDVERIFSPFVRVGATHAAGTGLGLAIAERIVSLHGGTIDVESTPGAGSTFAFTLPRADR
ncbi:MAG TPA: ATP-binding protein [Gaiellaceae bacterium]|nr:ATP-binding protein [Gaiellaceae bacterium]